MPNYLAVSSATGALSGAGEASVDEEASMDVDASVTGTASSAKELIEKANIPKIRALNSLFMTIPFK